MLQRGRKRDAPTAAMAGAMRGWGSGEPALSSCTYVCVFTYVYVIEIQHQKNRQSPTPPHAPAASTRPRPRPGRGRRCRGWSRPGREGRSLLPRGRPVVAVQCLVKRVGWDRVKQASVTGSDAHPSSLNDVWWGGGRIETGGWVCTHRGADDCDGVARPRQGPSGVGQEAAPDEGHALTRCGDGPDEVRLGSLAGDCD